MQPSSYISALSSGIKSEGSDLSGDSGVSESPDGAPLGGHASPSSASVAGVSSASASLSAPSFSAFYGQHTKVFDGLHYFTAPIRNRSSQWKAESQNQAEKWEFLHATGKYKTYLTAPPIQATELIDMINLQPVVSESSVSSRMGGNMLPHLCPCPRFIRGGFCAGIEVI